jgi:hypothetical protein
MRSCGTDLTSTLGGAAWPDGRTRALRHAAQPTERRAKSAVWQVTCEDFFQRWVPRRPPRIDLGAGFCEFVNHIRCREHWTADTNAQVRAFARPGVQVHCGLAHDLGWRAAASADGVFASNVFEHFLVRHRLKDGQTGPALAPSRCAIAARHPVHRWPRPRAVGQSSCANPAPISPLAPRRSICASSARCLRACSSSLLFGPLALCDVGGDPPDADRRHAQPARGHAPQLPRVAVPLHQQGIRRRA